ncbi:hypothetical protein SAMN04487950_1529 [Halogranum rubrum]|uniref:Uncharacterized protein n=1 Tax=Halogranum rubrum TaxID=553466 RepID=A0A1I4D1R9_9EURY|nr:hypothetical protein [Halogranum rubrum]SFK86800.1 hypothetical protein SAMN04487950_1529 [Halogranum rubrum]
MIGSRRSFLHAVGVSLVGVVAGCTAPTDSPASSADVKSTTTASSTRPGDTSTDTRTSTATEDCDTPPNTDMQRASGDSVSTNETVTDENVEYLPETDEVRYVAAWRHTNHEEVEEGEKPEREPVYETVPFEEWADVESANIAAKHVRDVVGETLPTEALSFGVTGENGRLVVLGYLEYLCDRRGTVISQPSEEVTLDAVADAAPATVDVSFTFEEAEATRSVPVYVRRATIHQE